MKLYIKQRLFTWFDAYDVYDENNQIAYIIKGHLTWGHLLYIYDNNKKHIASLQQRLITFLPKFDMFVRKNKVGEIKQEFSLVKPKLIISCNGWEAKGDIFSWNYQILSPQGLVATIKKEIFHAANYYALEINKKEDELIVLMIALSIALNNVENDNLS